MLREKTFLFTTQHPWDSPWENPTRGMALEVSRKNQVLYVNPPQDMTSLLGHSRQARKEAGNRQIIRKISPTLWVLDPPVVLSSIAHMRNWALFVAINKRNNRKLAKAIFWALNYLELNSVIHINDGDIYNSFYLKELIDPELTIYRRSEEPTPLTESPSFNRMEPLLMRKSDLILTDSEWTAESARKYNTHAFNIGRGVDLSEYDPGKSYGIPYELRALPRPIVGYEGLLQVLTLSPGLIYRLASQRPDYSIVLVGPQDHIFRKHALHQLPNVHFIDGLDNSRAGYLAAFDVCIDPQVLNETTMATYPCQIDESLALGKPVVTVDSPRTGIFGELVHLTESEAGFIDAVDRAVAEAGDETLSRSRIEFAATHSWEQSVNRTYSAIDDLIREAYAGQQIDLPGDLIYS